MITSSSYSSSSSSSSYSSSSSSSSSSSWSCRVQIAANSSKFHYFNSNPRMLPAAVEPRALSQWRWRHGKVLLTEEEAALSTSSKQLTSKLSLSAHIIVGLIIQLPRVHAWDKFAFVESSLTCWRHRFLFEGESKRRRGDGWGVRGQGWEVRGEWEKGDGLSLGQKAFYERK